MKTNLNCTRLQQTVAASIDRATVVHVIELDRIRIKHKEQWKILT